jgi:hypothetical protein
MNRRPALKTHEALLGDLVEQCQLILNEIDVHQKKLRLEGRTSDADKYYRTKKVIRSWCMGMEKRY